MPCNMVTNEFACSRASHVSISFPGSLSDQYDYLAEPLCLQMIFKSFGTSEIEAILHEPFQQRRLVPIKKIWVVLAHR